MCKNGLLVFFSLILSGDNEVLIKLVYCKRGLSHLKTTENSVLVASPSSQAQQAFFPPTVCHV